jgi:hypothetical protein
MEMHGAGLFISIRCLEAASGGWTSLFFDSYLQNDSGKFKLTIVLKATAI